MMKFSSFWGCGIAALLLLCGMAAAQESTPAGKSVDSATAASDAAEEGFFPHLHGDRLWVSGQMNFIMQAHPPFDARYTGANSLSPDYEKALSRVLTLYTGVRLNRTTEVLADVEETGGRGLSDALGIAGFSNLDAVRNPSLGASPYLARVMFHRVIALGTAETEADPGQLSTFRTLPERRLDVRVGKFGTVDFFDVNSVGSDSHFQFMNWSTGQNGAYDFAADTRGYTWGAIVEYQQKSFALRAAELLMPKVANGMDEVWNLRKARAENFELELHRGLLPKKEGAIRLLSYINHANMGIYREAVAQYEAGLVPKPDITAHPWHTTIKYGFGVNLEQALSRNFKAYARWGWNNGKTESFAYTEIDSTFSAGMIADGHRWGRNQDRAGLAFATNAISRDHQNYLARGGAGFIIGDGSLRYGRENIFESFYTAHLWRGVSLGLDLQSAVNPAYNRDRGPALIPGLRLHVEL